MMNDDELDAMLGRLGPPAGAEPRADAGALLARAALLAPLPVRPWSPLLGATLFAAGLLLGVAVDRLATGTPAPAAELAARSLAHSLWSVAPGDLVAAEAAARAAEDRGRLAEAEVASLRARLRVAEAVRPLARGAQAPRPAASAFMASATPATLTCPTEPAAPPRSSDDWDLEEVLAVDVLPGPNDLRLAPRERVERPIEAVADERSAATATAAPRPLPLDLLVAAAGGSSPDNVPQAEARGRVGAVVGVSWRPEAEGTLTPELFGGLGGGSGFSGEGADPFVLARIGAGVLVGKGFVRGAVDWSAALELNTEAGPSTEAPAGGPLAFRTGPTVAAVFGREGGVRARLGFQAELHQREEPEQRGVWTVDPGAALALEFPLGMPAATFD